MAWIAPKTWSQALVTVADLNAHIRDNQRSGPQANTIGWITQLGTPGAGARASLVSSGEVWDFVYDGAKWYSQPLQLLGNQAGTINSTTYATLAATTIAGWSTLFTAGAVPYWRVTGFVSAAAGTETTTAAVSINTLAAGGTQPTPGTEFGAVTGSASATEQHLDTGWVTTTPGSSAVLWAAIRIKSSGAVNNKTQARFALWLRLQSS